MERYGVFKTRKDEQKLTGLQNFLQTLNKRPEKEGEFGYQAIFGSFKNWKEVSQKRQDSAMSVDLEMGCVYVSIELPCF